MSCCGNHNHEGHQSESHQHGTHQHIHEKQNEFDALKEQNDQLRKELQQLKSKQG